MTSISSAESHAKTDDLNLVPVERRAAKIWTPGIIALFSYVTILGFYILARFGGQWVDGDMARIAQNMASILDSGSLVATTGVYANGYGYPALSLALVQVTGISIPGLQAYVLPRLVPVIVIVAFIAYRALLGRTRVALLATLLLFMHSDFLFVAFRGSHEKMTWTLVLLALFFLAKSIGSYQNRLELQTSWVLLFYFVVFTLIATNVFFASSFIWALAFSFGAFILIFQGLKDEVTSKASSNQLWRLLYVTLSSII